MFFLIFLVPLLVALGTFLIAKHSVTWQEFLLQLGASIIVAGATVLVCNCQNTLDVEIHNGSVVSKAPVKVSCEHSYCCQWCQRCSTDSKGHTSCHSYCCRTCYDHSYDVDWRVNTTINALNIDRIDRQGLKEPPRWTHVYIGEPVSDTRNYTNYIKASPDSLFRDQGLVELYEKKLPPYPGVIYDHYKINRFISNVGCSDPKKWNKNISEVNARVGKPKQANVVVVLTSEDDKFFYALRQHWLGGKKNDIIVVVGTKSCRPEWVKIMSWTQSDIFNIKLRDDLLNVEELEPVTVLSIIERNVIQNFQRKPMADFAYLKDHISFSGLQIMLAMMFNLIISLGISYVVVYNDMWSKR